MHESKLETLDIVQLKIKHRFESRCVFIEALCYLLNFSVDYYHQFFTGKVIKNEAGQVASSSVFGWVLSGRFPCAEGSSSCLRAETHSVRYFLKRKPDKNDLLREELNRFLDIETVRKSEENVIYQFENEIKFNVTKYVCKLPFKTDHDLLTNNYEVANYKI